MHVSARPLRSPLLVLLACVALAPTSAHAAESMVAPSEVNARLDKASAALDASEAAMEAAYSYEGAKATMLEAFQQAGLTGPVLQRASVASSAIYLAWRDVRPFYTRHREALAAIGTVVAAQRGATQADVAWLDRSLARLRTAMAALEQPFREMIALEIVQAQAAVKLAELKSNVAGRKRMMEQLGGGSDALASFDDVMEETRAQAWAAAATAAFLGDAVRADANRQLVGVLVPMANRVHYEVRAVTIGGPEPPPVKVRPAETGARTGMALSEAAGLAALATLRLEVAREEAASRAAGEDAAQLAAQMEEVQRPGDLDEVRELQSKVAELNARLESSRKRIAEISLDSPGGREEAERLAAEVIAARKELPGVQAELKRKQSDAGLAAWKKARRSERAERLATHDRARLAAATGRARMARARQQIREAVARQTLLEAEQALARIERLVGAVERAPQVERAVLDANGVVVLDRRRMGPSEVHRMRGDLRDAVEVLRRALKSAHALDAAATEEALEGVRAELRLGPGPWDTRTLGDAARSLGIGEVVGDDLVAVRGQAIAARYAELAKAAPDAMGVLAMRAEAPLLAVKRPHERVQGDRSDPRASVAVDTLRIVSERLAAASGARSRGFHARTQALLSAGEGATTALRPVAERSLRALLQLPVAEAADEALALANDLVAALDQIARERLDGLDPASGFELGAPGPVVEGEPVQVTLTLRSGAPDARPGVRLGEAQLLPVDGAAPGGKPALRYTLERAGGLAPAGQQAVELHITP
ncbi:MAG: hypothetical protein H6744_19195 [Deltaproteobacteria bacterium]|nr:hypothetical protein [Deltaproteobacteria bacterium]MCB9788810.1 hypothetical protein [Deltaproteobacteria bacterium]